MKTLGELLCFFCLLFGLQCLANAQSTQNVCAGNFVNGWILIDATWNSTSCGNPSLPQGNVWKIEEYDKFAVGATMDACTGTVPAGWAKTATFWNATRCGDQYSPLPNLTNMMTISHVSCVNEATSLCYPPTGTISASPTTVQIPYGQTKGSTTVSYTVTNPISSSACIWVQNTGGPLTLWACGGASSGTFTWSSVPLNGSTTFMLSESSNSATPTLDYVVVNGIADPPPAFSASPNPVVIPQGSTSKSYTLSWSTPGYSQIDGYASVNGGAKAFVGTAASPGSNTLNSETVGQTTNFWFYPHGSTSILLGTLRVTGIAPLSASPNPVIIPAGATSANFTLAWNTPGYAQVDGYASVNGGAKTFIGSAASPGSNTANSVTVGQTTVFWIYPHGNTTTLLGTVTVTGHH